MPAKEKELTALREEVARLQGAIRRHRDKSGHALCWLNDVELWQALGEKAAYPHETVPPKDEFLAQCAKYHESRVLGTPYEEPSPK